MGGELQVDASAISYYLSRTTTDKSGEMVSAAFCTKLLPTIIYVSWEFTLVALGIYALTEDKSVTEQPCGRVHHIWKFCMMNVVFAFITCATYFLWAGGGEGARARATLVTVFHFGFAAWGILLYQSMSSVCCTVLSNQFPTMNAFLYVSIVSNVAGFTLFFAHEAYLGRKLGWDYTLMSELTLRGGGSGAMGPGPFSPPLPHTPPSMGQQGVDAAQQATYPQQYNGADPGATDFSSGALSKGRSLAPCDLRSNYLTDIPLHAFSESMPKNMRRSCKGTGMHPRFT